MFLHQKLVGISLFPLVYQVPCPSHPLLFDHPNNTVLTQTQDNPKYNMTTFHNVNFEENTYTEHVHFVSDCKANPFFDNELEKYSYQTFV